MTEKEDKILDMIYQFGGIDGEHHKQWVLDQIVRVLTRENYAGWVADYKNGEDGTNTYNWEEGIAP